MTVPYEKDESTGVVAINCEGTAKLLAPTRPPEDTEEVGDWVVARNHSGRVFIPGNGEPYSVIVKTKSKEFEVCSGTTSSPTADKMCPVFVRVRLEEEVTEPNDPTAEEMP